MSIRVMTWVWEHAEVAGTDLLLLLAIADAADDQGRNAWPSVADLARKTRLDERTVQRRLKRLHSQGDITIEPGGGRRRNRYAILRFPGPTSRFHRASAPPAAREAAAPRSPQPGQRHTRQPLDVDWPEWCGSCDGPAPHERYVEDVGGVLIPCVRCRPAGPAGSRRPLPKSWEDAR
ncbi:helix-turn-helix domain-containing protein [Saccharothrix saharensis]|uniref:helix-turn-helix domain-containing protein n=1 Tax=Saccharothrix saharensis TaxID=571190 RepID=UPI003683212A